MEAEVKEPVQGFARVCEGEPLQLTLQYEDPLTGESRMAGGIGAVVQTAVKQPMSKERIEKQLGKREIRRIILKIWKWRQAAAPLCRCRS